MYWFRNWTVYHGAHGMPGDRQYHTNLIISISINLLQTIHSQSNFDVYHHMYGGRDPVRQIQLFYPTIPRIHLKCDIFVLGKYYHNNYNWNQIKNITRVVIVFQKISIYHCYVRTICYYKRIIIITYIPTLLYAKPKSNMTIWILVI